MVHGYHFDEDPFKDLQISRGIKLPPKVQQGQATSKISADEEVALVETKKGQSPAGKKGGVQDIPKIFVWGFDPDKELAAVMETLRAKGFEPFPIYGTARIPEGRDLERPLAFKWGRDEIPEIGIIERIDSWHVSVSFHTPPWMGSVTVTNVPTRHVQGIKDVLWSFGDSYLRHEPAEANVDVDADAVFDFSPKILKAGWVAREGTDLMLGGLIFKAACEKAGINPRAARWFKIISRDEREIVLEVENPGMWIGKQGVRAKAISEVVGKRIKFVSPAPTPEEIVADARRRLEEALGESVAVFSDKEVLSLVADL